MTREVIPAPPSPAIARPRKTCHKVAPAPLETRVSPIFSTQIPVQEYLLVLEDDSPNRAAHSEKGVGSDECGFPAVNVAQLTILPRLISAFRIGSISLPRQRTVGWMAHMDKLYVTTSQLAFSMLPSSDKIVL